MMAERAACCSTPTMPANALVERYIVVSVVMLNRMDLLNVVMDSVVDYLRAAQGIVGLQKKYGNERLEAACLRAVTFQSIHYKTIKSILQAGAEYKPLPEEEAFDALAETYTGQGRFCRNISKLTQ